VPVDRDFEITLTEAPASFLGWGVQGPSKLGGRACRPRSEFDTDEQQKWRSSVRPGALRRALQYCRHGAGVENRGGREAGSDTLAGMPGPHAGRRHAGGKIVVSTEIENESLASNIQAIDGDDATTS
jgi:hypothetical protein